MYKVSCLNNISATVPLFGETNKRITCSTNVHMVSRFDYLRYSKNK